MLKLFKYLKKYLNIIPFIMLLIAVQAIATLMLPDYMSKIISEGIKSPAYETVKANGEGENIVSVISAERMAMILSANPGSAALLGVKKYRRTQDSELILNEKGFAQLAGEDGKPFTDSGRVSYEKDNGGNYIIDPATGSKIVRYHRTNPQSVILTDKNGEALSAEGIETKDGIQIIAPYVTGVLIYSFDAEPAPLKLDGYGNAVFAGFYVDSGGVPYTVKMGNFGIPALKFEREGNPEDAARFGTLLLDKNGGAQLKQVSYIPVIIKYGIIMVGITFLISLCAITANYLSSRVAMGFGKDLRSMLYKKISGFSVFETGRFGTASLITRTTNDVTQVQSLTFMIFRMVVMPPIMFIGGLIMALNKNAQMTVVLLVSVPLILIMLAVVGKAVMPVFKTMQKKIDRLTLVARENLTGVRVIRAFGREQSEDKRFDGINRQVTDISIKANRIMAVLMPYIMLLMSLTALAIVFIAVNIAKNDIAGTTFTQFGNMMAVTQYIMQIMMSLLIVMMLFVMFPRASASAIRINEVLDTEIDISDPENPVSPPEGIKGRVKFDNVSFKFKGSENNVLSNISFETKPGDVTAIIGSTGSGKTTLINLIPRLFDTTEGGIYVDGVNVKDYKQKDLRDKIGFVPQKPLLFSGTVAENLKFGAEGAGEKTLNKALEISQAKEFTDSLPGGTDFQVEQGGVNFSGGQKQRLSIARALAKEAEIYIFDDSFSALDFKTDAALRKALKENIKESTVIIVAQRIGTVMNADNIIVLDEGKIVGTGKHKELMKSCPVYKEIALSQLSEEELS